MKKMCEEEYYNLRIRLHSIFFLHTYGTDIMSDVG